MWLHKRNIVLRRLWAANSLDLVCVGAAILVSLPHFVRALRSRRAFTGLFGVWDDWSYQPLPILGEGNTEKKIKKSGRRLAGILRTVASVLLWTPMGTGLDLGQNEFHSRGIPSLSRSDCTVQLASQSSWLPATLSLSLCASSRMPLS